jgi:hypothetical protein
MRRMKKVKYMYERKRGTRRTLDGKRSMRRVRRDGLLILEFRMEICHN